MILFFLALLLQASPAPSPAPAAPVPSAEPAESGWTAVSNLPPAALFRYIRTEPDGKQSTITGMKQICQCQPADFAQQLKAALANVPNANVTVSAASACGLQAQHILATGVAGGPRSNLEVYAFRKDDALYILQYTFQDAAPQPDAEKALLTHCP